MGIERSPRYWRKRRRQQRAFDAKCKRLAGPVVVTRVVGGEQPVRASSDESQQPRDDPARPE